MNTERPASMRLVAAALIAIAGLTGGCGDDAATSTKGRMATSPGKVDLPFTLRQPNVTHAHVLNVRAGVLPVGAVTYDNMTLPLVSLDGRLVATQTGVSPTWSTMLARPDASIPAATRVEIYHIEAGAEPQLTAAAREPVVLGRSSDVVGFLVESPREDGSRWIGRASWMDGTITWLVQDEMVNAFASLGPDGRLAWCRRPVGDGQTDFELVVRHDEDEWTIGGAGENWLMPTWSGREGGLFVMHLRDGDLDLAHAMADTRVAFRQSIQRISLGGNATIFSAFQSVNGQVTCVGGPRPRNAQLTFIDPVTTRAAVWRPLETGVTRAVLLYERSSFALVDRDSDIAFVTTDGDLMRQDLRTPRRRAKFLKGTLVVRSTPLGQWPYMMLAPTEGRIGLTALRLLPEAGTGPPN